MRFETARWAVALPAIRVCTTFVSLEPRLSHGRSQHGGHMHERAAAHGMWGEVAGHARAKANTRRIVRAARGEVRGVRYRTSQGLEAAHRKFCHALVLDQGAP